MKNYRECIQALLDGETLVSDTGVTVVLDSRGNPIISSGKVPCLYFTIPSQWSILKPEAPESTPHPHAELMALYAQDAAETDKPWERWEVYLMGAWTNLVKSPPWERGIKYRRKTTKVKKWRWAVQDVGSEITIGRYPSADAVRASMPNVIIIGHIPETEIEE